MTTTKTKHTPSRVSGTIERIQGNIRHNRWLVWYAYQCGIGIALVESGKINPRDNAGRIYELYRTNEGELHYSMIGQQLDMVVAGRAGWESVVGSSEWLDSRAAIAKTEGR